MAHSLLAAVAAAAPASGSADAVGWWIGGILVAVVFGGIVIRTLRRNRLRK